MKKYVAAAIFLLIPIILISAFNRQDFDKIVDFHTTLKSLSLSIKNNTESSINREKIYIINGIIAGVTPGNQYSFAVTADDFLNPDGFIMKLKNNQDKLLSFIYGGLSEKSRTAIKNYNRSVESRSSVIKAVCMDLKKMMKSENFFQAADSAKIGFSDFVKDYSGKKLEADERAFVNRLVIEESYPLDFKQFILDVEVAASEWIGYDSVESYKSIIRFTGSNCFGFFKRESPDSANPDYYPPFSTMVAVVKAVKPIDLLDGTREWLLDGIYAKNAK